MNFSNFCPKWIMKHEFFNFLSKNFLSDINYFLTYNFLTKVFFYFFFFYPNIFFG